MFKNIKILYVEDDSDIAEEIISFLKNRVDVLYYGADGQEGLEQYEKYLPDLVITDIQMPRMNGLVMSEKIRDIDCSVPIIITSAYNDNAFLSRAIELGISGYVVKPINLMTMVETIKKVLEPMLLKKALEVKNKELEVINSNLDGIVTQKTAELEYLYRHDSMTRLYNIVKLKDDLEADACDFLVLLDITDFSILNKQFGKEFGDSTLAVVADELSHFITEDIALYKVESDRFIFLLNSHNETQTGSFCESIVKHFILTNMLVETHPVYVAFKMGVAATKNVKYSIVNAEYALEVSKKSAHHAFCFFDSSNQNFKEAQETVRWLDITKEMLQKGLIEPHFQPILDVNTDTIYKYEVLARGYYEGEIIAPAYFLGAAERLGQITELTRMIIDKSFAYFQDSSYEFSINITEQDIVEDYLEEYLKEKCDAYGVDPSRITLEVLENVTTTKLHKEINKSLINMKKMGVKIAVDDFGIENSNFSRLIDIDFDYIKLDGLFIRNLNKNEKDKTIVEAIVKLAKTLGIKTVAEFVESKEIAGIVKACGIDYIQGYHIGKPEKEIVK